MKKIILLFVFMLIQFPFFVYANEFTIETKVDLEGKKLEKEQFVFQLKNKDKKVIQTKKNNLNGDVIFDSIEIEPVTEETDYIYYIEQVNDKKIGYTYDDSIVYVRVNAKPDGSVNVYYYKDGSIEEEMKNEIIKYEPSTPYHATEEELKGEAYAVLDMNNDTLYFKRYVDLDTSNFAYPFNDYNSIAIDTVNKKVYLPNVEVDKDRFENSLTYCSYIGRDRHCPKKIVFEDAIKPTFTNGSGLFHDLMYYAEEVDFSHLDTSNITDMSYMFEDVKVRNLDLSSFDTSNVTRMIGMFKDSKTEELDLTSFSAENLTSIREMFEYSRNLKILKISNNFTTNDKLTNVSYLFEDTPKLELVDMSWLVINERVDATSLFQRSGLKYLDLSNWTFKNKENRRSVFASSFLNMPNLVYVDLSNMISNECGSYGSIDFGFGPSLKVLKMNSNYNPVYSMMGNDNNNNYYNTNIGDFTDEIYYRDGSCKYLSGGSYIYIAENSAVFNNRYNEVPITNPNTNNVLLIVIILLALFIGCSNIIVKIYNNSN